MATVKLPYIDLGLASFEELDTYVNELLLTGDHPPLKSQPLVVAADTTLAQFQPVGYDANGRLVPATWNADAAVAIEPIGVCTQAVTTAAGVTTTSVPVFYSGCFNPEALVWHASFDTDAKKAVAFNGAASPTQIILRKRG